MAKLTNQGPSVKKILWMLGLAALIAAVTMPASFAEVKTNNSLDTIVELYRNNAAKWESQLATYATALFWGLAIIEFTWSMIKMSMRANDVGDWVAEVVNHVMVVGFFWMLVLHSTTWSGAIVNSFRTAANNASSAGGGQQGLTPSNIFDVGLQLANKIMDKASFWAPGDSLGLMISALIILVCFALIAAMIIEALVESYFVINAGVLFMGFGGARWTRDYAVKLFVYAVSVGAKLFVMTLIVGLGATLLQTWLQQFDNQNTDVFIMIGASIVLLALTKKIPDVVQGLINGTSVGSGGAVTAAAAAIGGAAVGAAGAALGAGAAVGGAARLASAQLASSAASGGGAASSGISRAMQMTGGTLKNLGSSAANDIGNRLAGRAHHGNMGGRMGASMRDRADELRQGMDKPQQPSQNSSPNSSGSKDNTISNE